MDGFARKTKKKNFDKGHIFLGLACIFLICKLMDKSGSAAVVDVYSSDVQRQTDANADADADSGEFPMRTDLFDIEATMFLGKPEKIIPKRQRKPDDEIRYAAFGSSSTWGAALNNRDEEVYVWRLSNLDHERGKNFAIRATGPNYAASCMSTMLGDDEFDVIILEYYMHAHQGLRTIAQRLRERFPDAIIVMTRFWGPARFIQKSTGKNLVSWASDEGFGETFMHEKEFHDLFLEKEGDNMDDWYFWAGNRDQKEIQEAAAKEVGAYMVKLPFSDHPGGPGGWLEIGDKMLAFDSFHLSKEGHQYLADAVKEIVDRVGVPKKRNVGQFSSIDQCYNWLGDGIISKDLKIGPNGRIVKMPNTEKYALEFDRDNVDGGNWITIENQSEEEMEIAVGYMTTGPPPSKYPRVEAIRGSDGEKYMLKAEASDSYGDKPVHISRLERVGNVGPKAHKRIHFNPLGESEWPFRLVQVMVTPINPNEGESLEIS